METFLSRSEKLVGHDALERLAAARIIVAGVGGVGSVVAEALVRGGARHLMLIDDDEVEISNINRQLQALPETV
ncbi:MAG: ThiF family adenylyltransferase, partial [Clostridiales bacterium]|nr:ThiF family adenylyltransferase [Clostridiales bacterium]